MTVKYTNQQLSTGKTSYSDFKRYLVSVYQYMTLALSITTIVAMIAASSQEFMYIVHESKLKWIIAFGPLAMAFYVGNRLSFMTYNTVQNCLIIFAILMGLSMSSIFIVFIGESIIRTLFITTLTFGVMSVYGYSTKKNLASIDSFLVMGAAGLIISGIVNIFLKSSAIYFVSSMSGILIFTLFIAYDTQRIGMLYYRNQYHIERTSKIAIYGSLTLYMDVINLFIFLLQLLGVRRND